MQKHSLWGRYGSCFSGQFGLHHFQLHVDVRKQKEATTMLHTQHAHLQAWLLAGRCFCAAFAALCNVVGSLPHCVLGQLHAS
jgi:hypothetical protein